MSYALHVYSSQYRVSGYTSWIGNVSEHDAVLIEILYDAGAVPFVRTNVPQTLYVWSISQALAMSYIW